MTSHGAGVSGLDAARPRASLRGVASRRLEAIGHRLTLTADEKLARRHTHERAEVAVTLRVATETRNERRSREVFGVRLDCF